MTKAMITGAQAMVKCLQAEEIEVVFGYPGAAICPFYDSLSHSSIRHILCRQEQNAGHMASGYARTSGKAGVCIATSGPGATNLITGIATAYMDSIPMVAITGQVPTVQLGRDVFQEADITGATAPFVKHSYLVKNAEHIPQIFKEAFYIAATGRPGPVLIDMPLNIQTQMIADFDYPEEVDIRGYKPSIKGHPMQIKRVKESLDESKRPLICVGGGVFSAGAQQTAVEFSERTKIPVISTMMGIGVLPSDHPLYMGMVGMFGSRTANIALQGADVLIIIGARVGDRAMSNPKQLEYRAKTIHIDVDPAEIGKNLTTTIPVVGNAGVILQQIMETEPSPHTEDWLKELGYHRERELHSGGAQFDGYISPLLFMEELSREIQDNAIVVVDVGQHQIWSSNYIKVKYGRLLTSGGLGTMGYSLPAAIGVKTADPSRQTIVICGDGGFQMMLGELSTLRQEDQDIKIILMNNRRLGMVREIQDKQYSQPFGVHLPDYPDFIKLAEAYGIPGRRISHTKEIQNSITEMLSTPGPYLLECRVHPQQDTLIR